MLAEFLGCPELCRSALVNDLLRKDLELIEMAR